MPRGGARPGSGRPLRGEAPAAHVIRVRLTDAEHGEMLGAVRDDETISQLLRDGGLRLVRARKG